MLFAYFFYEIIAGLIFGLVLGSFSTSLMHRGVDGFGWFGKRASHCPHCKVALTTRNLVPVFSWLLQGGRCHNCGEAIGIVYPCAELGVTLLVTAVFLVIGITIQSVIFALMVPFLVALVVIDLRHFLLPNSLIISLFFLAVLFLLAEFLSGSISGMALLSDPFAGLVVYTGTSLALSFLFEYGFKKEALGMGDVKFFAFSGLMLGPASLPLFCFAAGTSGVLFGLIWRIAYGGKAFPFGPALILTFYILFISGYEM